MTVPVHYVIGGENLQSDLHSNYIVDIIESGSYEIVSYDDSPTESSFRQAKINPYALNIIDWIVDVTPSGTHTLHLTAKGTHVIPDTTPPDTTEIRYAAVITSTDHSTTFDATLIV